MVGRLHTALVLLTFISLAACSPVSRKALNKTFADTENKFQDQTGFMLYDPVLKKTLYEYHSDRYFTPASNTKIFTFFASLNLIGDSIPALKYIQRGDSLIFWGSGDPSFMYKNVYRDTAVLHFLRTAPGKLYFSPTNFYTTHFGPGWAWDDYREYYSPERSPLPIYGNIATVASAGNAAHITPPHFNDYLRAGELRAKPELTRSIERNAFIFYPGQKSMSKTWDIPFHADHQTIASLLSDTLHRDVTLCKAYMPPVTLTRYSIPADSVYKVMMQESDNFLADQLLLVCSGIVTGGDTLQPEKAIQYIKGKLLSDLKDKAVWVDGSGLSRYNLFTPRTMVHLWDKIYQHVPTARLYPLLATGGKGTLRNWYKADKPYIFGKTGSLSNNHCLSGYLVTRTGRTLIFSFMNSNYTAPVNDIRKNMQTVLQLIYDNY